MAHHNNTPAAVLEAPTLTPQHVTTVRRGTPRVDRRHVQLTEGGPVLFIPKRSQAPSPNEPYVRPMSVKKRRGKKAYRHALRFAR